MEKIRNVYTMIYICKDNPTVGDMVDFKLKITKSDSSKFFLEKNSLYKISF